MHAPHADCSTTPLRLPRKEAKLFRSVRSSRDVTLAAFMGLVLAGIALHAGAFLPRVTTSPGPVGRSASVASAPGVAARAGAALPAAATTLVAPCTGDTPRG
jgi:hypothetical protein